MLVLFVATTTTFAQVEPYRIVVGAHLDKNQSSASIPTYWQGVLTCDYFTSGTSLTSSFSAGLRMPGPFGIPVTPLIEYRNLSSTFAITRPNAVRVADETLIPVPVDLERSYEGKASALFVGAELNILKLGGIELGITPAVGIPLTHGYTETESASNIIYLTSGKSSLETRNGSFDASPVLFDLGLGVSTSYRLKNGLVLSPSLRAMMPLIGIGKSDEYSWKVNAFSAGLSIGFDLNKAETASDTELAPPVAPKPAIVEKMSRVEPKRAILTASISAVGLNLDGTQVAEPTLTVERLQVTEAIPTLNYVFFKSGQASVDPRYAMFTSKEAAATFDERAFFAMNAEDVHHQILNIIGARMQADKQAKITLIGTRSVAGEEQADLGAARAEAIAKYLRDVWGIASNRIKVQPRQLPENASDDQTSHGQEENQRVEIMPNKPSIIAPLWANRIERVATPPNIMFAPDITADEEVVSAMIYVRQGDQILQTFDALTGGPVGERLWSLSESSMPTGDDSLVYDLIVRDAAGNEAKATGSIKLRHEKRDISMYRKDSLAADRKVEKYSLILFDYSSSELAKNQADTIINYVAKSIRPNSRLVITGHTDKTGNDSFNEQLAEQRAARAAELLDRKLRALRKSRPDMSVESHGSRDILFDNALPEGRFLSRTVRVTVEEVLK